MTALRAWNGGVILISHDERFITSVAKELWVCGDGTVYKFKGDVESYKVSGFIYLGLTVGLMFCLTETHCQQRQGKALKTVALSRTLPVAYSILAHRRSMASWIVDPGGARAE